MLNSYANHKCSDHPVPDNVLNLKTRTAKLNGDAEVISQRIVVIEVKKFN